MAGLMSGSWLSGRLAGKISFSRTIALGYLLMAIAAIANLGLNLHCRQRCRGASCPSSFTPSACRSPCPA
jgi:hypothetical protein